MIFILWECCQSSRLFTLQFPEVLCFLSKWLFASAMIAMYNQLIIMNTFEIAGHIVYIEYNEFFNKVNA